MDRIPGQALPDRVNQHHRALIRVLARILTQAVSRDRHNQEARVRARRTRRVLAQAATLPRAIPARRSKADPPKTPRDRIASIGAAQLLAALLLSKETLPP